MDVALPTVFVTDKLAKSNVTISPLGTVYVNNVELAVTVEEVVVAVPSQYVPLKPPLIVGKETEPEPLLIVNPYAPPTFAAIVKLPLLV